MFSLGVLSNWGKLNLDVPFGLHYFRCGIGRRLLAKMLLYPEMDRRHYGNDGYGAEHQNRKQNLNHHRDSGYQNPAVEKSDFPSTGKDNRAESEIVPATSLTFREIVRLR